MRFSTFIKFPGNLSLIPEFSIADNAHYHKLCRGWSSVFDKVPSPGPTSKFRGTL